MEYFAEFGYLGLFTVAFLAATILPIGSEVLLVGLLLNGYNPVLVVLVATAGNVLGSIVNYIIGYFGSAFVMQRVLKIKPASFEAAKRRYQKWGAVRLLFAWVPIIGDPLTVMAGVLKINIWLFIVLVTVGKLGRYIIVTYSTMTIVA